MERMLTGSERACGMLGSGSSVGHLVPMSSVTAAGATAAATAGGLGR
jgi:hypothetical protein